MFKLKNVPYGTITIRQKDCFEVLSPRICDDEECICPVRRAFKAKTLNAAMKRMLKSIEKKKLSKEQEDYDMGVD